MWGTVPTIILLVAVIVGAGLGWLVATRRHPGYVLGFSIVVLGSAGLLVASLPSILLEAGLTGEDPVAFLADQVQLHRIIGYLSAAAIAFALVAGVRALATAPGVVLTDATGPSSPREPATTAAARQSSV